MKNLHCCFDEKFIDGAISLFDSDSDAENEYVVVSETPIDRFSHIKNNKVKNLLSSDFISYIYDYDVIILHSLFALPNFSLISSIPREKKWFGFHGDGIHILIFIQLYLQNFMKKIH